MDAAHPLAAPLSRWRDQAGVRHLRLDNLPVPSLVAMVAEMLRVDPAAAAGLAEVIEPHTSGNPYETVELLNALRRDGVLTPTAAGWRWDDAAAVRAHLDRSEVAGLLAARVEAMPPPSRADGGGDGVPGRAGRAEPAADRHRRSRRSVVDQLLAPALDEGLLVVEPGAREAVRFRHDRIREAILGGLDPQRRRALQLAMARRLAEVPELFAVAAEQYLPVVDAVDDPAERRRVVALLRRAADQARLIGDHALVNALLAAALRLIDPAETATLIEVRTGRHAALYSLGRLEEADEEYRAIGGLCPTALDRADATAVQVRSLTHRNRFAEAIELGLESLRELRHRRAGRGPVPRRSSTTSSTTCTGGWTAPTRPTIWLGRSSPTRAARRDPPDQRDPAGGLLRRRPRHCTPGWPGGAADLARARPGPHPGRPGRPRRLSRPAPQRGDYAAAYRALRRILALGEARGYEPDTSQARRMFASIGCWFEPIENGVRRGSAGPRGADRGWRPGLRRLHLPR